MQLNELLSRKSSATMDTVTHSCRRRGCIFSVQIDPFSLEWLDYTLERCLDLYLEFVEPVINQM